MLGTKSTGEMSGTTKKNFDPLLDYCSKNGIIIHPSIEPKEVSGAGLGVYAKQKIKVGEKLVHLPTKHIFTTDAIPEPWLPKSARADLPVHAQLATFFAFGQQDHLRRYRAWLTTWPSFSDFSDTMPLFWGYCGKYVMQQLRPTSTALRDRSSTQPAQKKRKVSNSSDSSVNPRSQQQNVTDTYSLQSFSFSMSPVLSGSFLLHPDDNYIKSSMAFKMAEKLVFHTKSVAKALPDLHVIEDDEQLAKFFHAWCLVNTRCFYYFSDSASLSSKRSKVKSKPPSDPNEAMALCPFMDLFNHKAPPPSPDIFGSMVESNGNAVLPCKVKCISTGFTIVTASAIPANTEILLSYGAHTNDTLWSEYGFLLPDATNTSDSIPLDEIILAQLNSADKTTLADHGYLSEYTLHNDGSVCYRTEMVAWLLVLGRHKWTKVVEQGLDPEDSCTSPTGEERFVANVRNWLDQVIESAEAQISDLDTMEEETILEQFGKSMGVVEAVHSQSQEERTALAKRRRYMCLMRWSQIRTMAEKGTEQLLQENDG